MKIDKKHVCSICNTPNPDKGRAVDGRRAYRCINCGEQWTEGLQGVKQNWSGQRQDWQFHDSGATNLSILNKRIKQQIEEMRK